MHGLARQSTLHLVQASDFRCEPPARRKPTPDEFKPPTRLGGIVDSADLDYSQWQHQTVATAFNKSL